MLSKSKLLCRLAAVPSGLSRERERYLLLPLVARRSGDPRFLLRITLILALRQAPCRDS
jgi:hypothetical protein